MLTKSVEYAIKSLVIISRQEISIGVFDISDKLSIPKSYTSKILQILVKRGYISSQRGPNGGFLILDYNRSLKDLIIDIDGDLKYDRCAMGLSQCSDENPCPLHEYFKPIKTKILDEFLNIKIDEICKNPNNILKL